MLLTVSIPAWSLDEDGRVPGLGDSYRSWLVLVEAERHSHVPEGLQRIHGNAITLPDWAGGTWGRHPVRVDAGEVALYWEAPEPVTGAIELDARVEANTIDAPPGFPRTTGVVRRVRLEWSDRVVTDRGERPVLLETARYEDVSVNRLVDPELRWGEPLLTAVMVDLEVASARS